jgi:hypothetical protein
MPVPCHAIGAFLTGHIQNAEATLDCSRSNKLNTQLQTSAATKLAPSHPRAPVLLSTLLPSHSRTLAKLAWLPANNKMHATSYSLRRPPQQRTNMYATAPKL